eukprot:4737901-Pleurochrysis_carterae.AAC.1
MHVEEGRSVRRGFQGYHLPIRGRDGFYGTTPSRVALYASRKSAPDRAVAAEALRKRASCVLHALDHSDRRVHLGRRRVHCSIHVKLCDQHHCVQTMLPHIGADLHD